MGEAGFCIVCEVLMGGKNEHQTGRLWSDRAMIDLFFSGEDLFYDIGLSVESFLFF